MNDNDTNLGKIISSNSHIDYICEIYNEGMREDPPDPTDYEFGQFVYITKEIKDQSHAFIGVIYDTQIVDPDQGRTGPRLSQPEEQNIFQPSYVDEKQILAGIALLGNCTVEDGNLTAIDHSIPRWTLEVDDVVKKLSDEDMIAFHTINGEIQLEYYQRIIDVADGFAGDILTQILNRLKESHPEEANSLDVIQRNLEWQTKMEGI
ncbi:MAG: hypothetical protein ABEI06_08850 [Halobacteriaceae archaeon]